MLMPAMLSAELSSFSPRGVLLLSYVGVMATPGLHSKYAMPITGTASAKSKLTSLLMMSLLEPSVSKLTLATRLRIPVLKLRLELRRCLNSQDATPTGTLRLPIQWLCVPPALRPPTTSDDQLERIGSSFAQATQSARVGLQSHRWLH